MLETSLSSRPERLADDNFSAKSPTILDSIDFLEIRLPRRRFATFQAALGRDRVGPVDTPERKTTT